MPGTSKNTECAVTDPNKDVVRYSDVTVDGGDFSHIPRRARLFVSGSNFVRCDFQSLQLREVNFGQGDTQSTYVDCSFDGTAFRAAAAGNARFTRCSFRDVKIRYMIAGSTEFIDCTFTGELKDCVFWGRISMDFLSRRLGRVLNEFSGNDLSEATLIDCGFRGGIDLTANALPPAPDHLVALDGRAALERALAQIAKMPASQTRDTALLLGRARERIFEFGQSHLWMSREDGDVTAHGSARDAYLVLFDTVVVTSQMLVDPATGVRMSPK